MAHALTTNLRLSHFNATFLTDNTAMLETFVLTAETFVILDRTENTRTEQAITLGLEGTVVNRLRFFHFPVRPGTNHIRRGKANSNGIELIGTVLVTQKID